MKVTTVPVAEVAQLLANALGGLFVGSATDAEILLVKSSFSPGPGTTLAELASIEADFDGYARLVANDAQWDVFYDPATSRWIAQASPPAGGWYWQTSGTSNLPQTIFGGGIAGLSGNDVLGASFLLANPVTLTAVNQVVQLGPIRFQIDAASLIIA